MIDNIEDDDIRNELKSLQKQLFRLTSNMNNLEAEIDFLKKEMHHKTVVMNRRFDKLIGDLD